MSEALDRRIRLIYDALETRNWKSAIKQSTTALSKHKDDYLILSLKCYALTMAGKREEASLVCDGLVSRSCSDTSALHLVNLILKELRREHEITAVYLAASTAHPRDAELLEQLFGAYAREGDFVKQQQIALKLQKLDVKDAGLYAWWGVVSLVLQANTAASGEPEGMSTAQLLYLAQSLTEKRLADPQTVITYEQLMLYVHILKEQGKLSKALEVIQSPKGEAIKSSHERALLQAELMNSLGMLEESAELAMGCWRENSDDWPSLRLALDSLLPSTSSPAQCKKEGVQDRVEGVQDRVDAAQRLIDSIQGSGCKKEAKEATMAALELQARLRRRSSESDNLSSSGRSSGDSLASAALEAFKAIGHTVSCARELRLYISKLDKNKRLWLVGQIQQLLPKFDNTTSLTLREARMLIAAFQIECEAGLPEYQSSQDAEDRADHLMGLYASCRHLYAHTDEKDTGPADDLPVLAVSALVAAWNLHPSGQPKHLLQAVVLLDEVQAERKVSAGLRLAQAALYSILGAPLLVHKELAHLQIKHIQHDTLSVHLHLPALVAGLCDVEVRQLLSSIADLFRHHQQECAVTLMTAYTHGSYTKVLEFQAFKERLLQSYSRAAASVQACLLGSPAEPGKPSPVGVKIRHNEDLGVRPSWYPPSALQPELALAEWWQQARGTSYGLCDSWWGVTAAADCTGKSAAQYQAQCGVSLRRYSSLAQLITVSRADAGQERNAQCSELVKKLMELDGLTEDSLVLWMQEFLTEGREIDLIKDCDTLATVLFFVMTSLQVGSRYNANESYAALANCCSKFAALLASGILKSQEDTQLLYFGPHWAAASAFLQQLHRAIQYLLNIMEKPNSELSAKARQHTGGRAKSKAESAEREGATNGIHEGAVTAVQAAAILKKGFHDSAARMQEACPGKVNIKEHVSILVQQVGAQKGLQGNPTDAVSCMERVVRDQHAYLQRLNSLAVVVRSLAVSSSQKKR